MAADAARSPDTPSPDDRGQAFTTAGIFVAVAAIVVLATRRPGGPIDFFEDGHWLGTASDMLAGKIPYRDTFPVHGFLSDGGMDWILFALFGPSLPLSRSAHYFLSVLFQPSLYLVAAAGSRRPGLAALTIPLNLAFATQILADRPVFPLLALVCLLQALARPERRGRAFFAGALAAFGLFYALEFGTFVLAAGVVTAGLAAWTRSDGEDGLSVKAYLGGVAAVLAPAAIGLASVGALLPFLRTSFVELPLRIHSVWGMDFPTPRDLVVAYRFGSAYRIGALTVGLGVAKRLYLTPLLGGGGLALAWFLRRRGASLSLTLRLTAVSLACLACFRYVIYRLHLQVGNALTGPLFFLILVAIHQTYAPERSVLQRRRMGLALVGIGALGAIAMNAVLRTAWLVGDAFHYGDRMAERTGLVPLETPRGRRTLVPRAQAAEIAALDAWLGKSIAPGASILEMTNRPALYFLLARRDASRFYQVPLMRPYQEDVIRELRRAPPAAVLLRRENPYDTTDGIPNPVWVPEVWRYLEQEYPRRVQVGETLIALPRS